MMHLDHDLFVQIERIRLIESFDFHEPRLFQHILQFFLIVQMEIVAAGRNYHK
jgi:hypothetical protein